MLKKIVLILLLTNGLLLIAADSQRLIFREEFETTNDLSSNWEIIPETGKIDVQIVKENNSENLALKMQSNSPASAALLSRPLKLKTGRLYRLTARVCAENLVANPLDRYPTSVAACLSMANLPFTNHSPAIGGSTTWKNIDYLFIAVSSEDRIRLNFGFNGTAQGTVWFDQIELYEEEDLRLLIPPETVQWFQKGYRFPYQGWIYLHLEGSPYERGLQHGWLLSEEIVAYMRKLAIRANEKDPPAGWQQLRFDSDALFLRNFDTEFLEEMQGIADGLNRRGAKFDFKPGKFDLLDIVTLNSAIDLGQLSSALRKTPHSLSGKSFQPFPQEENQPERLHKCSGFLANRSATKNGDLLISQMFMWNGYTGVHWNIIVDLIPDQGYRLIYQTFPGGIHSGADFYLNSAGLIIGETTVMQTPFDISGFAQASRIRKAAQYAANIDQFVRLMTTRNNGLYTNDWLLADYCQNEIAIFLLGTKRFKLWRGSKGDFPGKTIDFYWSVNNNKDDFVRREYLIDHQNAPQDLIFNPANRDLAFYEYYQKNAGKIDLPGAIRLLATSPINRPHACDGKITSGELAKELGFLAHYGKTTLREKFPGETLRLPALPDAIPHLTLGYATFSAKFFHEQIKKYPRPDAKKGSVNTKKIEVAAPEYWLKIDRNQLWQNTIFPASEAENWLISASAAYWKLLDTLPENNEQCLTYWQNNLAELNLRMNFLLEREGSFPPLKAARSYQFYNSYQLPRIRGLFFLHQLRLIAGNEKFFKLLREVHRRFQEREISNNDFLQIGKKFIAPEVLEQLFKQWIASDQLPAIEFQSEISPHPSGQFNLKIVLRQKNQPLLLAVALRVETESKNHILLLILKEAETSQQLTFSEKPLAVTLNPLGDIPLRTENFFLSTNFFDEFAQSVLIYQTSREIEAAHTLALRYQTLLADTFSEVLIPLYKDYEVPQEILKTKNLIICAQPGGSDLLTTILRQIGLQFGNGYFYFQNKLYNQEDDGLVLVLPSIFNHQRFMLLIIANSSLQLYQMTKNFLPPLQWGIFKKDRLSEQGFFYPAASKL